MTPVTEMPAPATATATVQYGGFWRRVLAYLLDAILLWLVFIPISLAAGFTPWSMTPGRAPDPGQVGALMGTMFLIVALEVVGVWLYYALMESSKYQGTLGKMALGMRVTDMDGNRISFGKATGRFFAKILSGIILYIGFMMVGWTKKKQGLHDMVVSTLVLRKTSVVPPQVAANAFQSNN